MRRRREATASGRWRRRAKEPPRFVLLTRAGCHLCAEMEELLREVLPAHGLELACRDVDSDPGLRRRFGEVIPVLLRDGRPVAKLRLERRRLERLIRRRRRGFVRG